MSKLHLRFLSHLDRHKMKAMDFRLQESVYSKNHFFLQSADCFINKHTKFARSTTDVFHSTGLFFITADLLIRNNFGLQNFVIFLPLPPDKASFQTSRTEPINNKRAIVFFFWVNPRCLNFMCRRFETTCHFRLHISCKDFNTYENGTDRVFLNVCI